MAFFDAPIVDANSRLSEQSVLQVKLVLGRHNGFLSREETPDYGADLDVELIQDGRGASSQKFAVQIKSTATAATISLAGELFLKLSFETSRLGYLCRRLPAYGIIVLYEEASRTCYFDYVEDIVRRVSEQQGSTAWQQQYRVTIYLPRQVLNEAAARALHEKMTRRHDNHGVLFSQHAAQFNIPVFTEAAAPAPAPADRLDNQDPAQLATFLERFGGVLYNTHRYGLLLKLLARLPAGILTSSPQLLFIAAITYSQTGQLIDADYYLSRCFHQLPRFDAGTREHLEFARIKVAFMKGDYAVPRYVAKLAELKAASASPLNALTFEINIVHLSLIEATSDDLMPATWRDIIEQLFEAIEQAPLAPADKLMLRLYNADNLHIYGSNLFLRGISKLRLQQDLGVFISPQEQRSRLDAAHAVLGQAVECAAEVLRAATANDLLLASAYQYLGRFFFSTQCNHMMVTIDQPQRLTPQLHAAYVAGANHVIHAYDLFQQLQMRQDAHHNLGTLHEIQLLYGLLYNSPIGTTTLEELNRLLQQLEEEAALQPFRSSIRATYEGLLSRLQAPIQTWAGLAEEHLPAYALKFLDAYGLPPDRLPNILADIRAKRTFERTCRNDALELTENLDHLRHPDTLFARLPTYRLRHQLLGLVSPASADVDWLLAHFITVAL